MNNPIERVLEFMGRSVPAEAPSAKGVHGQGINPDTAAAPPNAPAATIANGRQQPMAFPALRCRPLLVSGTPILRDTRALAPEIPVARFQENENPYLRPK